MKKLMIDMMEKITNAGSKEDHVNIPMECDFNLNYEGSDEDQFVTLSRKTTSNCLMELMTNKKFMHFKNCKPNSLLFIDIVY